MSEATQREWRFYLDDMIAFAEKVILWSIIRSDVPVLLPNLRALKNQSATSADKNQKRTDGQE